MPEDIRKCWSCGGYFDRSKLLWNGWFHLCHDCATEAAGELPAAREAA